MTLFSKNIDVGNFSYFSIMIDSSTFKFIFTGKFALTFDSKILQLVRTMAQQYKLDKAFERNLTFLVTEFTQNIIKHQEETHDEKFNPGFGLFFDGVTYQIFSSNTIEKSGIKNLEKNINIINSKTKEELIEYYKQVLTENTFSEKSGAGLGLIEFARRTGNPLAFKTEKISEQINIVSIGCRFTLKKENQFDYLPEFNEYYMQNARKVNTLQIQTRFDRLFGNNFLSLLPILINGLSTQSQSWKQIVMVFKTLLEYCNAGSYIKIDLKTEDTQTKLSQNIFVQSEQIDTMYEKLEPIKTQVNKNIQSGSNNELSEIILNKGQSKSGKTDMGITFIF